MALQALKTIMKKPRSLQTRLAVSLGLLLTALWIAAASVTTVILRNEMDEMFDAALQEMAQRLLPLAVVDIIGREDDGIAQRLGAIREHDEFFTYIVRDDRGRVLLQSHSADASIFPADDGPGFKQTETHRLFTEEALQGSIRLTVAEPIDHRAEVAREIQVGLGLPLFFVLPAAFLAIVFAVRASLSPLRRFREGLEDRSARDLSPLSLVDVPTEIAPLATTLNGLLGRLKSAFDAERSFAANAAHELRTPLAGAIAQAQRLQSESTDPAAAKRASDIEATLKRLTARTERLMQLARAEGARLHRDQAMDLRLVLRVVAEDMSRSAKSDRIALHLPDAAVMSDLDPDAVGILCRNLLENALRHGDPDAPVDLRLDADGRLRVANNGPVIPSDVLSRLTQRFERADATSDGSGLGLAIVAAIAERVGSNLTLSSPRTGGQTGFEATLTLPVGPDPASL